MEIRFYWKVVLLIMIIVCVSEAKKKKKKNTKKEKKLEPQYYLMNFCNWTFNMHDRHLDEVLFGLTSSGIYGADIDCQMPIVTSPGSQLSFKVLDMSLQSCHDSVSFYDGNSTGDYYAISPKLCSKTTDSYRSSDSNGVVRFQASGYKGKFVIQITSFYTPEGECLSGDSRCGNGLCIREKLFCNRRDNCGDNSDETHKCGEDDNWWLPIPCVGGFIFLLFLCIVKSKYMQKARIAAEKKKAEEEKKKAEETKKKAEETKKIAEESKKKKADEKKEERKKKAEETKKARGEKEEGEEKLKAELRPIEENACTVEVISNPRPVQEGNQLRLEPELQSAPAPMMGAWEHPAPTPGTDGQTPEKQQLESLSEVWTSSIPQNFPPMNSSLYMPTMLPTMLPPPYTELPMTNLPNMNSEQQVTPDPPPLTFVTPMESGRLDESGIFRNTLSRPRFT